MNIEMLKPADIIPYENNPRRNAAAVDAVAESIKEFGFKVPIIIDEENIVIAGHTRLRAAEKLGLDVVPVIRANDLTEEQVKAFRLADNKTAELSAWDFEALELELFDIENIDMSLFGFEDKYEIEMDDEDHPGLNEQFVVPPFSVLDTRQGYWQDRKRHWLQLTGNLSETRDGEYGRLGTGKISLLDGINAGTSNFDPVLAEIAYKWFCIEGGKILDPFAGEQTKGVVAGELGYKYVGCEIRPEQVDVDKEQTKKYKGVEYVCGDSVNISKLIKARDFDMCFTSPPYYDLEIYSKDDLSALGTYEEFMLQYCKIFKQCFDMLRDNTFLVVKVGEIRNKKTGEYRSFVPDTIKALTDIGFAYYNELTLISPVGTAHLRASKYMKSRKVAKLHQNVLVFYKGDIGKISEHYPPLNFDDLEGE